MGNGRERSKRETFMEEKEILHYPEWIEALNETTKGFRRASVILANGFYSDL